MTSSRLILAALLLVPAFAVAQGVGVEAPKVVVVDGSAAGKGIKITILADDAPGATLPPLASMTADVTLVFGGASTTLSAPAGAYDGTRGWRIRSTTATYADRTIRKGTTGIAKLQVKAGRLVKATLWAETLPDAASTLHGLAWDYDGTSRCSQLTCTTKVGGSIKVTCRDGAPDAGCTVVSTTTTSSTSTTSTTSTTIAGTCGNGILEGSERCDGGPWCHASCVPVPPNCCQQTAACVQGPSFTLYGQLAMFCGFDATAVPGGVCAPDGSCTVEPIATTALCCQKTGSCHDGTASDTEQLWSFRNSCEGLVSGQTRYPATCVADTCTPQ